VIIVDLTHQSTRVYVDNYYERFEDTKGVIRSHKTKKKDRQYTF